MLWTGGGKRGITMMEVMRYHPFRYQSVRDPRLQVKTSCFSRHRFAAAPSARAKRAQEKGCACIMVQPSTLIRAPQLEYFLLVPDQFGSHGTLQLGQLLLSSDRTPRERGALGLELAEQGLRLTNPRLMRRTQDYIKVKLKQSLHTRSHDEHL